MNEFVLLDTDITSYIMKRDSRAEPYKTAIQGKRCAIAFITVAEIYKWGYARRWEAAKRDSTRAALQRYVIIPYQERIASKWGEIAAATDGSGRRMSENDCWIAAIAAAYDIPLATNNVTHFEIAESFGYIKMVKP